MEEQGNLDKATLIKQLLLREQKRLRLNKRGFKKLEMDKLLKKEKLIEKQLLEEKAQVFGDKTEKESSSRTTESQSTIPFTSIQRHKLHNFLQMLNKEEKLSNKQKDVRKCVAVMNSTMDCHWNLPITILRAVKDCILYRKWNNLTQLLLVLIKLPTYKYKSLIRHLCHILDKVHPVIQENGLTGQLRIIQKAPHLIRRT